MLIMTQALGLEVVSLDLLFEGPGLDLGMLWFRGSALPSLLNQKNKLIIKNCFNKCCFLTHKGLQNPN